MNCRSLVVLDLDGPLLDGKGRHYACYRDILAEHGFAPLSCDDYWRMKREGVDVCRQLAASGAETITDLFRRAWLERIELPEYLALDVVQPGAVARLTEWRGEGRTLALATMRRSAKALSEQLRRLELLPILDLVVRCDPSEGIGKAAAVSGALGADFSVPLVWIGDTEADISAARALGCPVWALSCGLRTAEYLRALNPDYVSDGLCDVDLSAIAGRSS